MKIGNFFYSFSRSIQNIAHHSQSLFNGVISEGGGMGLHVLLCDTAYILVYFQPLKFLLRARCLFFLLTDLNCQAIICEF